MLLAQAHGGIEAKTVSIPHPALLSRRFGVSAQQLFAPAAAGLRPRQPSLPTPSMRRASKSQDQLRINEILNKLMHLGLILFGSWFLSL